eukprot:7819968-Ditylum_brightwellii.AAC.1
MEGIDDSNWEDYNHLCHKCFSAKFAICKKQRIGYQDSDFDFTKETSEKRRGGQVVTVQEIKPSGVGRWVIDQNQLYTDIRTKDYKDFKFVSDNLRIEYNYVPYVPPNETKDKRKQGKS